jgi:hypothetical protein
MVFSIFHEIQLSLLVGCDLSQLFALNNNCYFAIIAILQLSLGILHEP